MERWEGCSSWQRGEVKEVEATSAEYPFRKFSPEGHEGVEAKASGKKWVREAFSEHKRKTSMFMGREERANGRVNLGCKHKVSSEDGARWVVQRE